MVGLIPDITKVCSQGWKQEGDLIYLLGTPSTPLLPHTPTPPHLTLGGSEYLAAIHGIVAGKPPAVDFELERRVQEACRHGIRQGWLNSAHDLAEGGLAVALAECCISGQLGAEIYLQKSQLRFDEILFGETASNIVVSVKPECQGEWEAYLKEKLDNSWQKLGTVRSDRANLQISMVTVSDNSDDRLLIDVTISNIQEQWATAIARRLTRI
jgi:phosphoribosylformylglycinamidine synthase